MKKWDTYDDDFDYESAGVEIYMQPDIILQTYLSDEETNEPAVCIGTNELDTDFSICHFDTIENTFSSYSRVRLRADTTLEAFED